MRGSASHARIRGLVIVFALMWPGAARAGDAMPFTDEAISRGIDYTTSQAQAYGHGTAFADLDEDGDPDVVVCGRFDGLVGVFENDGAGFFTDRSATSGIALLPSASGIVAGDYDNDGDLDLYISQTDHGDVLYRNDGAMQFTEVTSAAFGSNFNRGYGQGCAWGDYDNDGFLDLYVANRPLFPNDPYRQNKLYHNQGNGTFVDVAVGLGVDRGNDPTFQPAFFDFDLDGDADLYLATDKGINCESSGWFNHLFENVGGTFVDITESSNTAGCISAMCITVADFDGNGYQDIYCTNEDPGNALFMNQGDVTFTREEAAAGVEVFSLGWGAVFFDCDNNGAMDLYVCNELTTNRLFLNGSVYPCAEVAGPMGVADPGQSMNVAVADIDDDGDLDMMLQNKYETIRLFVNNDNQQKTWAKFDIVGQAPMHYAVGAQIKVRTAGTWRIREVIAGSNFKNQNELVQHFGLDDATVMDEVWVMWPGGDTRTLTGLPVNQTWRIYPPERLGDADADGFVNADDIDEFVAVVLGLDIDADRVLLSDLNGDGGADGADVGPFAQAVLAAASGPEPLRSREPGRRPAADP